MIKVNIQDAADYYFMINKKEFFDYEDDFLKSVSPWEFAEYTWIQPEKSISKEMGVINALTRPTYSYIVGCEKNTNKKYICEYVNKDHVDKINMMDESDSFGIANDMCFTDQILEGRELGWVMKIMAGIKYNGLCIMGFTATIPLNKEGKPMFPKIKGTNRILEPRALLSLNGINVSSIPYEKLKNNAEYLSQGMSTAIQVLLMGINFCNCKNVKINDVKHSRQVLRNFKRKGLPVTTEKILEISSVRRNVYRICENMGEQDERALHLCRGHFKIFTKEKPLLGRHTGMYWWDMHTRGNGDNGVVKKDYQLKGVKNG